MMKCAKVAVLLALVTGMFIAGRAEDKPVVPQLNVNQRAEYLQLQRDWILAASQARMYDSLRDQARDRMQAKRAEILKAIGADDQKKFTFDDNTLTVAPVPAKPEEAKPRENNPAHK